MSDFCSHVEVITWVGLMRVNRSTRYAADLYASAFVEDLLNEEAGKSYRYVVLQPGSSQSEMETLEGFLGRKLKFKAFFDELDHL